MTLPYDYARCMTPCAIANLCRRTDPGREWMQPMSVYPGGPDCCGLIKREEVSHDPRN